MGSTSPHPSEDWLADYELAEQVETNAFTATFVATRRVDKRSVLIKTIKPGLRKRDRALSLLAREREVIELTAHTVLPALLETLRAPDRMALVFAHGPGRRLSEVLESVPKLRVVQALAITAQLAGALAALHRAGYVHARLRAESIELREAGIVYLHDPGGMGARGAGGDPDLDAPENMAPEQVLGRAAGPETDVYLLGKLLYRLITGTQPFSAGAGGITQQIRHADPAPLPDAAPEAPRELQRIVTRCLRKRGRDRYPDMPSLQSELLRVMRSQTSLGSEHLVAAALADAGLASALPAPRERGVARGANSAPPWLAAALRYSAVAVGFMVLLGIGWAWLGEDTSLQSSTPFGIVKRPALVRLLAQPWAEVHIDGDIVATTPVGHPIEVTPGHHVVVFRHPNAEYVERQIEISAGQTILLDVTMPVVRPVDAGTGDASDSGVPDATP